MFSSSGTTPVCTITGKASRHFPKHKAKANIKSLINSVFCVQPSAVVVSWEPHITVVAHHYEGIANIAKKNIIWYWMFLAAKQSNNKPTRSLSLSLSPLYLPIMLLSSSNREIIIACPSYRVLLPPLMYLLKYSQNACKMFVREGGSEEGRCRGTNTVAITQTHLSLDLFHQSIFSHLFPDKKPV